MQSAIRLYFCGCISVVSIIGLLDHVLRPIIMGLWGAAINFPSLRQALLIIKCHATYCSLRVMRGISVAAFMSRGTNM